jgi:hypothetical protein
VKCAISIAHIITASGMRPQLTWPETDTPQPESKAGIAATYPSWGVTPIMAAAPRPGRRLARSESHAPSSSCGDLIATVAAGRGRGRAGELRKKAVAALAGALGAAGMWAMGLS